MEGDITGLALDAIVNPANSQLVLGAGVAGAIRKKGGPSIQEECDKIGGIHVGGAVITTAGFLPARYVIHAVGPRMGEGEEEKKLKDATLQSLALVQKHDLSSIAFPAIGTGIFGFPMDRCAAVMLETVIGWLEHSSHKPVEVVFCLFGRESFQVFRDKLEKLLPF